MSNDEDIDDEIIIDDSESLTSAIDTLQNEIVSTEGGTQKMNYWTQKTKESTIKAEWQ